MPVWTSALLAGGSIYAGVRVVQNRRRKRLAEHLMPPDAMMMEIDRKLSLGDWLLGDERRWSRGMRQRRVNFNLAIATGAIALTGVGVLVPGLTFVGTVFVAVATLEIYRDAISALINERRLRHSVIDSLAITTALTYQLYFASAVATGLYFLGMRMLIAAEIQTNKRLTALFEQNERFVWQVVDGQLQHVLLSSLDAGDVIAVEGGEIIPVDGTVIHGMASVDQHVLTGESQPVTKGEGDTVYAATMMNAGTLHISIEKAGDETIAMEIAHLLAIHNQYQSQVMNKAEVIADRAAVPTLGMAAVALATLGPFSAAAVLNANFSEILRITMPLSLLNHIDLATQYGILVKDAQALETLRDVDTFVFDKTGTLTVERPIIAHIYADTDTSERDVLWFAALAEQRQSHPIAEAIMAAARAENIELPHLDESAYEVGFGLRVEWDHHTIFVGSERYFTANDITFESFNEQMAASRTAGNSCVLVGVDGQTIGVLELASQPAPEARDVVAGLQARGLDVYIISGDHEMPTRHLAQQLGIKNYIAQVLPQQKSELVKDLQNEGRTVCFVGDGINDALALQQADVAISLQQATALAVETAQIVLHDDLSYLLGLLELTDQYHDNVRRTLSTIYGPGLLCIGSIFVFQTTIMGALTLYYLSFAASVGNTMLPLAMDRYWRQTSQRTMMPIEQAPAALP